MNFTAERRIRVHTLCIPVTDNINDVFHNADQQAITGLIAKMGKYLLYKKYIIILYDKFKFYIV